MTREDTIRMAREAGFKASVGKTDKDDKYHPDVNAIGRDVPVEWLERFAALVAAAEREKVRSAMKRAFRRMAGLIRADEREAVAKMFDEPMILVPFVQNHLGGCMVCGFTPKMAANAIRARGQA